MVSKRINPQLKVSGIILCMFDSRVTLSSEVKADIEKFLESAKGTDCPWSDAEIIPVHVRRNIKLAEAPSYGKTIFEYEPKCHGSNDYKKIAQHIASMNNGQDTPEETAQTETPAPETPQDQTPSPHREGGDVVIV